MRNNYVWLAMLGLIAGTSLHAQTVLSLDESIDLALQQNVGLEALRQDVEAGKMKIKQAYAAFLPQVSVASTFTRAEIPGVSVQLPLTNPVTGLPLSTTISTVPDQQYDTRLQVVFPIFLDGRQFSGLTLANLEKELKTVRLAGEKKNVVFRVKELFFNLLKLDEAVNINRENARQVERRLAEARALLTQGVITKTQVLGLEVQAREAAQALTGAENNAAMARLNFAYLLNVKSGTALQLKPVTALPREENFTEELAQKEALQQRTEIKVMAKSVEMTAATADLAKTPFWPNLTAVFNYGWREETYAFDPDHDYWVLAGNFEWNLFSGGNDYYKVQEARFSREKAEQELTNLKRVVALSVSQAYLNWDQAKLTISVAGERLKSAEENYAAVAKNFEQGVVSELAEKDARLALNSAKKSNAIAIYDLHIARAQLDNAMGVAEWSSPEVNKVK
jgi:outer membrane protein TolC